MRVDASLRVSLMPMSLKSPVPSALRALVYAGILSTGLAAAGSAPAAAQGFEGNFMDNALEFLGLKEEEAKPEIDYRERAPLVVPPKTPESLPPPQASAAEAHPNWPKDPDVARRKREAEAAKQPVVRDDPGRPLLPSELNKGRRTTLGTASNAPTEPVGAGSQRDVLMPSQLGFTGWMNSVTGKQDQLTFNGEPERENLLQPPPGYQTPAPNAPYGVVEDKKEPFKFPTLFDRQQ
ncbi:hypothetical protein ACI7BZ_05805 [Xanthobacter sp. AM11]|uniref:hypothetical protein n=1 Tax=Xanthobacter sp. AM11 TaxID=3380643 RepID=UPI0039BF130E